MEKKYVVVTRLLTASECQEIDHLQYAEVFSTEVVPLKKYRHVPLSSEQEVKRIRESFESILRFGYTDFNGKPPAEWMQFEGTSFWYYLRFSLFYWLFPLELESLRIRHVLDRHGISSPVFYTYHSHAYEGQYRLPVPGKGVSKLKVAAKAGVVLFGRFWLGLVQHFRVPKNKNFVINFLTNKQRIIDINGTQEQRLIYGDYCSEYLLDKALSDSDFYFFTDFYFPKLNVDFPLKKTLFFNKFSAKSLHFEFYAGLKCLNPFFIYRVWAFRKRLKLNLGQLSGNTETEKHIVRFCRSKINLLTVMYAREQVFKGIALNKRIKSITAYSEFTYLVHSLIRGGKKAGVPSVAFQHGIIHPDHMHYMYDPQDLVYDPLPDHLLLWGSHWRDILLRHSAFPPESVVTLGQLRTDVIPKLKKETDNPKTRLMYASQTHSRPEFRKRLTQDIFRIMSRFPDMQLVIKPHPLENDCEDYFAEVARETGFFDWELTRNDLYVELSKSDLVLTYNSTVGAEAIYFKKPLLNFDYEDNDVLGYTKYPGAVFKATTAEELDAHLRQYQAGVLPVLEAVQDEFIHRFCYAIDGNTAQRYIEFIRRVGNARVYNKPLPATHSQHEH